MKLLQCEPTITNLATLHSCETHVHHVPQNLTAGSLNILGLSRYPRRLRFQPYILSLVPFVNRFQELANTWCRSVMNGPCPWIGLEIFHWYSSFCFAQTNRVVFGDGQVTLCCCVVWRIWNLGLILGRLFVSLNVHEVPKFRNWNTQLRRFVTFGYETKASSLEHLFEYQAASTCRI